jgi:methyltransferase (TIGR00027 family)
MTLLAGVGGTGLAVAVIRAQESARPDRLFDDPLAAAFAKLRPPGAGQPGGPHTAALRAWVVARTVFLDDLLISACADGIRQVVLLGAGFDARAFRLPWPDGVRCFEVDTPDVLASKEQVVAARRARPGCTRLLVPADLRTDWPARLKAAGFDPARPTVWIAEGLLVYLDPDEVDRLAATVTRWSAPGSRLGLTFRNRAGGSLGPALRRSAAPDDPVGWLAGHGWAATLSRPRDVLAAHGRTPRPPAPPGPPRALLASARLAQAGPAAARSPARPVRHRSAATTRPARSPARGPGPERPLPALLSQVLTAFTIEFDNESEHRMPHRTTWGPATGARGPWLVSEVMWANFLRFIPDGGVPLREVAALATTVNLTGLQRWGYLRLAADPAGSRAGPPPRDRLVQLTQHGAAAARVLAPLATEIEERWRDRLGAATFGTLRSALADLAGLNDAGGADPGRLPYLPVSGVYPADPATVAAAAAQAASRWPGGAAGAAPGRDLPGLLSAVLLSWRLEYEHEAGLSLPVSATALRVLTSEPQPVADLPGRAGVAREAIAVSLGRLARDGYAATGPAPGTRRGRAAWLTERGAQAQADYERLVTSAGARWRSGLAADSLTALAAAGCEMFVRHDGSPLIAAGLVPYPEGWRAHPPYRARTEAMISDPAAALPHYPMVSHRGGYPDGS